MPSDQLDLWFRLFVATIGGLCIYLGYKLFCDVPFRRGTFGRVLVMNLVSGAALAIFGIGILVADASSLRSEPGVVLGLPRPHPEPGSFNSQKPAHHPRRSQSA